MAAGLPFPPNPNPIKDPACLARAVCMKFILAMSRGEHWSAEYSLAPLPVGVVHGAPGKGKGNWVDGAGVGWAQGAQGGPPFFGTPGPIPGVLPMSTLIAPIRGPPPGESEGCSQGG